MILADKSEWTFCGGWSVSVEDALANPHLDPRLRQLLEANERGEVRSVTINLDFLPDGEFSSFAFGEDDIWVIPVSGEPILVPPEKVTLA